MIRIRFAALCFSLWFAATTSAIGQALTPGNLLVLNGTTNDYVYNTNYVGFPTNSATVEMWMRTTATNPGGIFSYATTNSDNALLIYNPARLEVWLNGAATIVNTNPMTNGAWYHIAVAWTNAGPTRVYVNGVQTFSGNIGLGQTILSLGSLVLGQDQDVAGGGFTNREAFNGQIDEVRIWNYARSVAQIQTNRHVSLPNSVPGLVAYYRFDETVQRSSSGGYIPVSTHGNSAGGNHLARSEPNWDTGSSVPFVPVVTTYKVQSVTPSNAVLTTTVYQNNVPTGGRFEWGTSNAPFANASEMAFGSGGSTSQSVTLSNLTYGTTYYYRLIVTNSLVTNTLATQWFTAGLFTVTNLADSGIGSLRDSLESAGDGSRIVIATNGTVTLTAGQLTVNGNVTIHGPGASNLVINARNASRLFWIPSGRTVLIEGLTLTNGHAPDGYLIFGGVGRAIAGENGGAINNAGSITLSNCVIVNCRAGSGMPAYFPGDGGSGGAINNTGETIIENCSFMGNSAGGRADGTVLGPFSGGYGGAINNSGSLVVRRSSFTGNRAGNGGSGSYPWLSGGAGGHGGAIASSGNATLTQCTISGNQPGSGGDSGGEGGRAGAPGQASLFNHANGTMTVESCTVVSNTMRGSVFNNTTNAASLVVRNTIAAGNEGGDLGGPLISQGYNLVGFSTNAVGITNGANFDRIGTPDIPLDPELNPLTNAGGITLVHTFAATSPVFDTGDDALVSLGTDQRGASRLFYNHVDIGAVEFNDDLPRFVTTGGATPTVDAFTGSTKIVLTATAMPGSKPSTLYFDIGPTTAYGGKSPESAVAISANPVPVNQVISAAEGYTIHYRAVLSNEVEVLYGADRVISTPFLAMPGDTNRDGVLSEGEMQSVLTNYFQTERWLTMTNTAGLGSTNVSFALTTNLLPAFNVSVSTNLMDWELLGPALPRYDFADSNAVDNVQRYYRLEVP